MIRRKTAIIAAACACIMSVPAAADIAPPDPAEITRSGGFAENSLMEYSAKDPDIKELIARMDRGEIPESFDAGWIDENAMPAAGSSAWTSVVDMYNSLADMEVTDDDADGESVPDDAATVVVEFHYDDLIPLFYFFVDGEDVYALGEDCLLKVKDDGRVLEGIREEQEKAAKDAKWLDSLDGAVLKARQENWNLVDGSGDFLSGVEYAVTEDGTVYSREKYNISGYDHVREEKMTEEDFGEFMSVVKSLRGGGKNVDGTDGYGWRIWRPGKDGSVLYEFTGYADGDGKLSRITSMLEKYRPFVIY